MISAGLPALSARTPARSGSTRCSPSSIRAASTWAWRSCRRGCGRDAGFLRPADLAYGRRRIPRHESRQVEAMSLWLTEVLAPETLYRHVALFLVVVALAMPTIALVRWTALVAGVAGTLLATVVSNDPIGFFWWGLLVIVTLARLAFSTSRRPGRPLTAEEQMFRDRAVPMLSKGQVRRLLEIGRLREVTPGTTLTRAE